jgi:hypothetical protein
VSWRLTKSSPQGAEKLQAKILKCLDLSTYFV